MSLKDINLQDILETLDTIILETVMTLNFKV